MTQHDTFAFDAAHGLTTELPSGAVHVAFSLDGAERMRAWLEAYPAWEAAVDGWEDAE
jgi:hypothetical protein